MPWPGKRGRLHAAVYFPYCNPGLAFIWGGSLFHCKYQQWCKKQQSGSCSFHTEYLLVSQHSQYSVLQIHSFTWWRNWIKSKEVKVHLFCVLCFCTKHVCNFSLRCYYPWVVFCKYKCFNFTEHVSGSTHSFHTFLLVLVWHRLPLLPYMDTRSDHGVITFKLMLSAITIVDSLLQVLVICTLQCYLYSEYQKP